MDGMEHRRYQCSEDADCTNEATQVVRVKIGGAVFQFLSCDKHAVSDQEGNHE